MPVADARVLSAFSAPTASSITACRIDVARHQQLGLTSRTGRAGVEPARHGIWNPAGYLSLRPMITDPEGFEPSHAL